MKDFFHLSLPLEHLLLFAHSPRSKEMHNFLLLHPYFLVCNTKIMQNLFTALPVVFQKVIIICGVQVYL